MSLLYDENGNLKLGVVFGLSVGGIILLLFMAGLLGGLAVLLARGCGRTDCGTGGAGGTGGTGGDGWIQTKWTEIGDPGTCHVTNRSITV